MRRNSIQLRTKHLYHLGWFLINLGLENTKNKKLVHVKREVVKIECNKPFYHAILQLDAICIIYDISSFISKKKKNLT